MVIAEIVPWLTVPQCFCVGVLLALATVLLCIKRWWLGLFFVPVVLYVGSEQMVYPLDFGRTYIALYGWAHTIGSIALLVLPASLILVCAAALSIRRSRKHEVGTSGGCAEAGHSRARARPCCSQRACEWTPP